MVTKIEQFKKGLIDKKDIVEIKNTIDDLTAVGYIEAEVLTIGNSLSDFNLLNATEVKWMLVRLIELNYTKNEAIKTTVDYPEIFTEPFEQTKQKIKFYQEIGLKDLVLNNPKILKQSFSKSYLRYKFFNDSNILFNLNDLFMDDNSFEQKFKITYKQLKQIYNYQEMETLDQPKKITLK